MPNKPSIKDQITAILTDVPVKQPKPNFDLHFKRSIGCFILFAIFIATAFLLPLVKRDGSPDPTLKGILILSGMGLLLCACVCMDRSGIKPVELIKERSRSPVTKDKPLRLVK
jgi:hypothetical protein